VRLLLSAEIKGSHVVSRAFTPNVSFWQTDKLFINIKISNLILFKTKQNRQRLDLHFSINNTEIDRVNEVLFLGVILDEHLSWQSQIQNVARKISKSVGII